MTCTRLIALALLGASIASPAALAGDTLQTIRFAAGASSGTFGGSLVRGDSHIYAFDARMGQAADIAVTSLESNASLTMYAPGSTLTRSGAEIDIGGNPLAGGDPVAGLDPGAFRHWAGTLPASGTYYILVAGDRGNATYELIVSIR